MFIISKRNFLVHRADGSAYIVKKDFVGDIPEDVANSGVIQGAIKGGLVAAPDAHADKAIREAKEAADEEEAKVDKRTDTKDEEEAKVDKRAGKK